ncbi:MAG: putative amidohydrolase YtcJ [Flavobacteriaceae bacterium]|jgi:predicted amidohydrolase YtcJ
MKTVDLRYKSLLLFFSWVVFGLVGCDSQPQLTATSAVKSAGVIYHGGDIVTMAGGSLDQPEAVVEQGGKIVFIGTLAEAARGFAKASKFELKGKTLMPGFIEPHVHPSIAALVLPNEIIAPYDWVFPNVTKKGVRDPAGYKKRLEESINRNNARENTDSNSLFMIWGYHQLWHGDLSREILNRLAPNQPVAVIHRSFHEIFFNDRAIDLIGLNAEEFKNNPQVNWEKGHFFESGWMNIAPRVVPFLAGSQKYMLGLDLMSQLIQKNGITTIAEPGSGTDFKAELGLLSHYMAQQPPFNVYLIASGTKLYRNFGDNQKAMELIDRLPSKYNTSNLQFLPKQVKLFADGAIYSQLMQMKDGYLDGHHGEWMTPLEDLTQQITDYWRGDYKVHIHANGDKGIQQVIETVTALQQSDPRQDHRLTLHHMGYFDDQQAAQIANLGIEASVNPFYLWALADKYAEFGLGEERAHNLVRIKSLTDRNVPVSFHSDFSMAPIEPLTLVWTAVNRIASEGIAYSPDQKIDVYTALKAVTISAARTINLEQEIGSIEIGKQANFVILENNPMRVEPQEIKDIKVYGTVFKGKLNIPISN